MIIKEFIGTLLVIWGAIFVLGALIYGAFMLSTLLGFIVSGVIMFVIGRIILKNK